MHPCRDLASIIAPTEQSVFLTEYWQWKPLVVRRADLGFYTGLFAHADVEIAVAAARGGDFGDAHVQAVRSVDGVTSHTELRSTADGRVFVASVHRAYAEGHTIIVDHINRTQRPVAELCNQVESVLQHPVGCNLFLTPPHACGFVPHYDAMDTFFLQVSGTKRWSVWEPVEELPMGDRFPKPDPRSLGRPLIETELAPGDALYLPRGWIHHGETGPDASLHLTLGVSVTRWAELLVELVRQAARDDRRLREAVPLGEESTLTPDDIHDRACDLLTDLAGRGVASGLSGLLDQRLRSRPSPLGDHFDHVDAAREIGLDTAVIRRAGLAPVATTTATSSRLSFPGSSLDGPVEAAQAFALIASRRRLTPRELPAMPDDTRVELVRRLVHEGLFSIASDGSG